jgi:hypothetical protein
MNIIGISGTVNSTLPANLFMEDFHHGSGGLSIDAKGDAADEPAFRFGFLFRPPGSWRLRRIVDDPSQP